MTENHGAQYDAAAWKRLHQAQIELRLALGQSRDDGERAELKQELEATRQAIAKMESMVGAGTGGGQAATASTPITDDEGIDEEGIDDFLETLLHDQPDGSRQVAGAIPPEPAANRSGGGGQHGYGPDEFEQRGAPVRRQALWILLGLTLALNLTYILSLLVVERPEEGYITLWDGWIYHMATLAPAALAAFRAITDRRGRAAWWLITIGIVLFGGGNLLYTYRDQNLDPVPFPGWSDVLYLESTLALAVALGLVTHLHVEGVSRASRLNGLVIGLSAAAVAVVLWFDAILEQSGSTAAVLVGLAYPLFDLVFIVIALSGLSLARYRPSASVTAFIAAAALWAVGDLVFLRQIAEDTYVPGTILEATWVLGIFFFGLACWLPQRWIEPADARSTSVGMAFIPWVAALAALGVIGWSIDHDVPSLAVWLAMASLIMVMVRIGLALSELRQANEAFSQAWISEVAGFRERAPFTDATVTTPARTASSPPSFWIIGFGAIATTALVGVGVLLWQIASDRGQSVEAARTASSIEATEGETAETTEPTAAATTTADVEAGQATNRPGVTAAPGTELLTASIQQELDRLLAFTPIVFGAGEGELSDNHRRALNNVAAVLLTSPGMPVTVIGYTDDTGTAESNLELSTLRAAAVRDYLVSQGVPEADLVVEGRGQAIASGTTDQSGLERRVEFEVVSAEAAVASTRTLQLGIVASSASNDLAFTQSMVDSLNVLAAEREGTTVTVVDNVIVPEDAAAAVRTMAEEGHGMVIAHDPRLGALLPAIAAEFPDVLFAWGPTTQAPSLPNIYTYTVAAEQGAYVLGALAASLTTNDLLGVVGPIEAGDAQRYVAGFVAGAEAERPGIEVLVHYTGSFLDASYAAETATAQVAAGADVVTAAGPVASGAAQVAIESNVRWMGNYVDQSAIGPDLVVASQVYHWDVPLREILADFDNGARNGRSVTGTMANGGVTVEINPGHALGPELVQRANELVAGIADQTIVPPAS